jgi:hypothetical protein
VSGATWTTMRRADVWRTPVRMELRIGTRWQTVVALKPYFPSMLRRPAMPLAIMGILKRR